MTLLIFQVLKSHMWLHWTAQIWNISIIIECSIRLHWSRVQSCDSATSMFCSAACLLMCRVLFKSCTPRHVIITLPKIKQKVRILEAARNKPTVTYKGVPIRLSAGFSKETLLARRAGKKYSKSWKARTYIQDCSIQQSFHLEWKGR